MTYFIDKRQFFVIYLGIFKLRVLLFETKFIVKL